MSRNKPKFTIKGLGNNPLGLSKQTTKNHLKHQQNWKKSKTCIKCNITLSKLRNDILPCPNCGLYTLHLKEFNEPNVEYMENEAEIYCSACGIHWGRTNN